MQSVPPEQPRTGQRGQQKASTGTVTTTPLTAMDRVSWSEMRDSTGSATAIPLLLGDVARGDAETATAALKDLRERICQYGFVVEQATAATVPFLWELAQLPQVTCRAQILRLLKNIADTRQWESIAGAYPKLLNHRENPAAWERAAREAVHAQQDALDVLASEDDTEIAHATTELARTLGRQTC
ncbi:threonine synthase [Streptomyces aurantiacus]|uniref:hypothetical protein n=1 Tax=Streptomyces aurantiacus TaxID=47760 RepID=UPI00279395D4|nr:hypothetical protein [Streptomyces aurantiacus]MDQ0779629.1 threonine synthase [Streptomyces aurantiacus]